MSDIVETLRFMSYPEAGMAADEIERLRSLLKEAEEALELTLAWAPSPILSEHASSLEFSRNVLSKIKGEA